MCWRCGKAYPRILPAYLMVSLPIYVSYFDLNIVYTNMLGVTWPMATMYSLLMNVVVGMVAGRAAGMVTSAL